MASGGDDGGGQKSSWWGWDNLVKVAKEKTMETLEIVKSDFSEFTNTMSEDTTNFINTATAQLVEKSNKATYLLDTFDNKVKIETTNRLKTSSTVQERYENELKAIQLTEDTYLKDPEQTEEFITWKENFNSDSNKQIISDLLIENSSMRLIYSKLVPAQISNDEFWCRYFFKTNLFEEEQKKRIKLLERVTKETNNTEEEEAINWDEDEDDEENENDNTINNSGQSNTDTKEITTSPEAELKEATETKENDLENEIEEEITNSFIKEHTTNILNEVKDNMNEEVLLDDKNAKQKTENMNSSVTTENSDEWDKVSTNESDEQEDAERRKILENRKPKLENSSNTESSKLSLETNDNNDEWDDWGE